MKVLVTGATGFVGHYVVEKLLNQEYEIKCLVRDISKANLFKNKEHMEFVEGDVTKPDTLKGISQNIDYVIHLAAKGVVEASSSEAYDSFLKMNEQGTLNLLNEFKNSSQLKKFIHFSSTAAMGFIDKGMLSEKDEPNPLTPYQRSKRKSEQVVIDAYKNWNIPCCILRPCMIYGIGGKKGEYLKFCRLMKKGVFPKVGFGANKTPMVYVSDVANAAILALTNARAGETYIISGPDSASMDDFHREVMRVVGKKGFYPFIPKSAALLGSKVVEKLCLFLHRTPIVTYRNMKSTVTDRTFDISKARAELKYVPEFDMKKGTEITVRWYLENGIL